MYSNGLAVLTNRRANIDCSRSFNSSEHWASRSVRSHLTILAGLIRLCLLIPSTKFVFESSFYAVPALVDEPTTEEHDDEKTEDAKDNSEVLLWKSPDRTKAAAFAVNGDIRW